MISSREFFELLDGQQFSSQTQLEDKIRERYIECLSVLPPDVTLVRLMAKAKSREWIIREQDNSYRIVVGSNGHTAHNGHVPNGNGHYHGSALVAGRRGS